MSGPDQFRDWMMRRFPASTRPQRDVAALFGWNEGYISKILNGSRLPGLSNAIIIQSVTGIPVTAWLASHLDTSSAPDHDVVAKP